MSTGIEYRGDGINLAAAYSINLNQSAQVGSSGLLAGEYSRSRLTVGTQALALEVSLRLKRQAGLVAMTLAANSRNYFNWEKLRRV